ncbi:hypothetical protein HU200_038774 [Digitaria exilis]|uniref:KIB1-4 beta-propeller domain-containing protein n=1 Tax=Digitaria exilis TaxID=1010633 RepID=A0A835BBK3_9POAL|nr:hypothetical protein HU200_038774 [Digitaria exilis]
MVKMPLAVCPGEAHAKDVVHRVSHFMRASCSRVFAVCLPRGIQGISASCGLLVTCRDGITVAVNGRSHHVSVTRHTTKEFILRVPVSWHMATGGYTKDMHALWVRAGRYVKAPDKTALEGCAAGGGVGIIVGGQESIDESMDEEKGEDGSSFYFPSEFRTTAAYAVDIPGAEGRNPTLVDPCNHSDPHEVPSSCIIGDMRGKRCIACTGSNWFLLLDMATRECFLTTLFTAPPPPPAAEGSETTTVVPLPPMPDDPPQLEFLFNCALSCPSSPALGCAVVLGLIGETFLRYCRVGDETWSHVEVTFDDYVDVFDGAVAFHEGKIYATTNASYCVVVDASSGGTTPAALRVERTDIKIPGRYPNNLATRPHLVATTATSPDESGDLYFVRPYFFGFPDEVVDVDDAWREVDGIGHTTLFVGYNCLAVSLSPAGEDGTTESNTIHILRSCYDGVREDIVQPDPPSKCLLQWSSLPTDLLAEHVVPRLSFIDFLHLKSVCKDWNGISTRIGDTKAGFLDVFDPVTKKNYTLSVQVPSVTMPSDDYYLASLMPHYSKNGWLVVSRGHSFFLVNPFERGDDAMVVHLPPVNELFWFKGISFCSTPGSPDFMVMAIEGISNHEGIDTVRVRTWRPEQESWEKHDFECEARFLLATHNPLFLDGEFYCIACDGKLGAFNPKTMAWRVLHGLAPIHTDVLGEESYYTYPVEWKGEVVVVFHDKDVQEPIQMFRLDRSRMAWEKLEDLEEGAMFWDRKQPGPKKPGTSPTRPEGDNIVPGLGRPFGSQCRPEAGPILCGPTKAR